MKRPLFVLIAAVALIALASPAHASGGTTVVWGHQSPPVASCMGESSPNGTFEMTGDLIGCWWIDDIAGGNFTPSGNATFTGTEHFTGCIDQDGDSACTASDPWGTFHTTFKFTAQFDTATGAEIHGRCHHPIVGGTDDFANISGVIRFHDIVTPTDVSADYSGPIRL
jgi:hypothetical protein